MSNIITTDDLNTYTGNTLDTGRASQVVAAVNQYIETRTGRVWGDTKSVTETHDAASVVFLNNMDVTAVSQVKLGYPNDTGTVQDSDSYNFNSSGRLVLNGGRSGFNAYRDYVSVTYTHGVTPVPDDLKLAALSLASDFYNFGSDGQKELSSESIGSYSLTYRSGKSSEVGGTYWNVIDSYRKRLA